jgi:23S rRNA (uracil1939-C5)-methyltransferase
MDAEQERETARLTLEEMWPRGDTLAHLDEETVNVFGGIPGEEVVAEVFRFRRRRQKIVSARVIEVLTPSPYRVSPPCPYFGPCSGCQWQHIEYSHQLDLKRDAVREQLDRYDTLRDVPVSPTVPGPEQFNYRNHGRFTIRGEGWLGFVNRITRRFVRIDECMLMAPGVNGIMHRLQGRCRETTQLSIRYGVNTSEFLVQPTLHSEDIPLLTGQTHYRERLLDRTFRVASPSFFQVNTKQTERLIELVRARLELAGGELLVDAYAGVGTFAVAYAPAVRRVVAIEESAAAVNDAAVNTIGLENLDFIEGKTEEVLDALDEKPDAVILDPPRVGCRPATLDALVRRPPGRVVYVSCEPESLARDLHTLAEAGFTVETVEPVDMFPQTYHLECVATLTCTR